VSPTGDSERELREEIARLDAEITVLERVETLNERARADLEARRTRRDRLAAALAALRETI
jgi:chromosome segregation ATPase